MKNLNSEQEFEELAQDIESFHMDNKNYTPIIKLNIPFPQIFIELKKERKERKKRENKRLEKIQMFNDFMIFVDRNKLYQISELVEIYNRVNSTNITSKHFSHIPEVRTCFIHKQIRIDSNERITIYQRK